MTPIEAELGARDASGVTKRDEKIWRFGKNYVSLLTKFERSMEEKKYPVIEEEEEGVGMVSEPMIAYAATGSGYANTLAEGTDLLPSDYDPGIGPYSMEELNARIDEAEAAIIRAEQGDMSDWVTPEELDAELHRQFSWLR